MNSVINPIKRDLRDIIGLCNIGSEDQWAMFTDLEFIVGVRVLEPVVWEVQKELSMTFL